MLIQAASYKTATECGNWEPGSRSPEEKELTSAQLSNLRPPAATPKAAETADAGATNSPNSDKSGLTSVQLVSTTASTASQPAAADTSDDRLTELLQPTEFDFPARWLGNEKISI